MVCWWVIKHLALSLPIVNASRYGGLRILALEKIKMKRLFQICLVTEELCHNRYITRYLEKGRILLF